MCKLSHTYVVTRTDRADYAAFMQEIPALDGFDVRLLSLLQEDGRMSVQDLADRVGLSASQCSRRRARLEEAGVIAG